jgi:hypothetical protein
MEHIMTKHEQEFYDAYTRCIFWAESEIENKNYFDLSENARQRILKDCVSFCKKGRNIFNNLEFKSISNYRQAGVDFFLTRNGHGAGFWDGGYWMESDGEKFTKLSKEFGEINFYVGDDGKIYCS